MFIYLVIGIEKNVSLRRMLSSGYSLVYDKTYAHETSSSEIDELGKRCTETSFMCLGGGRVESDIMDLVACGNCLTLIKRTPQDIPTFNSGAYWYFTENYSIGFSDTSRIRQGTADTSDCRIGEPTVCSSENKLSWHLGISGGWRVGKNADLNENESYKKYILLKI